MRLGLALAVMLATLAAVGWALAVGAHPAPPTRPIVANGPISLPDGLATFDSTTGASVDGPSCSNCGPNLAREASWSPDGSALAFVGPTGGLWVWREGDTIAREVGGCPDASCYLSSPTWSPDGQSILYIAGGPELRFTGGNLYVLDVASGAIREVPRPAASKPALWARWTTDDRITFVASTTDQPANWEWPSRAWTMALDGSDARSTVDLPPTFAVAISPTGEGIAYVDDPRTGVPPAGTTVRLWIVDTRDESRRLLYERPGCCLGPHDRWACLVPGRDGGRLGRAATVRRARRPLPDALRRRNGCADDPCAREPSQGSPAWRPTTTPP